MIDHGTTIDTAVEAIETKNSGRGCLLLVLALLAIMSAASAAIVLKSDPKSCTGRGACVDTATNGASAGSAHLERVTPQGSLSDDTSGSAATDTHDAAAAALASGQGTGGVGNSLNPQAAVIIVPNEPSHTPPAQLEPTTPAPAPAPPPPCDTSDPHSPCYQPPCDTSDPHSPCYEPPPYHPGDECDHTSPYYDPTAICL